MKKSINILEIQESISKKHNSFLSKYKNELMQLPADHRLIKEIAITKLKYILNSFTELHIIDSIEIVDGAYTKMVLSKNGYDEKICVFTNGDKIIIGINSEYIASSLLSDKSVFEDVTNSEFEWKDFSLALLDKIHKYIYSRESLSDRKLMNIFENNPLK